MSLYEIAAILGSSVAIAAVVGLLRFSQAKKEYRLFLFIIWLGLLNHTYSLISIHYFRTNTINSNLYVLIEGLLYIWLFRSWGLFQTRKYLAPILTSVLICAWVIDNLVLHTLHTINSGYRIIHAFVMIFLAIEQLSRLITLTTQGSLFRNPMFIICCGVLIYFTYKAFVEVFFLVETNASLNFMYNIYFVFAYINCFVNLLFAWAIVWIPKKNQSMF
jgi:hypothetical protein